MGELEDISFKNRVLFFEEELMRLHRTGKPFIRKTKWNKENWDEVIRSEKNKKRGGYMRLTPKAIAVLSGMDNLDNIDDDRGGGPISQLDILNGLDRIGYSSPG